MLQMAEGTVRLKVPQLLKTRGIKARDLVEKTGMAYNTALALERGATTRIDLETLARLCDVLGVGVDELMVYEPPKKRS